MHTFVAAPAIFLSLCFAVACGSSKSKRSHGSGGASGAGAQSGAAGIGASAGAGGVGGASGGVGGVAGQAGVGNAAGGDAGPVDAGPPKCPTGMVFGPSGKYCIDSTEVPRKGYENWLATSPTTTSQIPECQFNTDFTPSSAGECSNLQFLDPFVPQTCVDWCDAQAYCQAQSKRLCGQIGGPAGVSVFNAHKPLFSQWNAACSNDGTRTHPYGAFSAGKCNDKAAGKGTLAKVPFNSGACPGGVGQLYDMSGNAREWIDSCATKKGAGDQCLIVGGSYESSTEAQLACNASGSASRNTATLVDVGFRCCWDVP